MNYNLVAVGDRIVKERKALGLTQDQLLEKLQYEHDRKVDKKTWSAIENGVYTQAFDLKVIYALSDIFECSVDYLLCKCDEKEKKIETILKDSDIDMSMIAEYFSSKHFKQSYSVFVSEKQEEEEERQKEIAYCLKRIEEYKGGIRFAKDLLKSLQMG